MVVNLRCLELFEFTLITLVLACLTNESNEDIHPRQHSLFLWHHLTLHPIFSPCMLLQGIRCLQNLPDTAFIKIKACSQQKSNIIHFNLFHKTQLHYLILHSLKSCSLLRKFSVRIIKLDGVFIFFILVEHTLFFLSCFQFL